MKFRDLTWLIVVCLVAVASTLCGFWLGDFRLRDKNSQLNYELVTTRIRVEELEDDLKKAGKTQNIDAIVKLEKLTDNEDKFISTQYRLKLIEPVPLRQLLESDIVPRILAIGATVKFQILSAEEAKKRAAKFEASPAIVVTATKGEFTFKDEIVFTVYFPAAASYGAVLRQNVLGPPCWLWLLGIAAGGNSDEDPEQRNGWRAASVHKWTW